jgi:hypothetical protein
MTLISDQAPPRDDYLLRRLADLERQVKELAAARRLEAATIGAGGITIKGGALRVLDDSGDLVVQLGRLDSGRYGLAAVDLTGETVELNTLAFGQQSASVVTQQGTTSTGYTDLATTGPTVPGVAIGTSGRCLVIVTCLFDYAGTNAQAGGYMSYDITGATAVPAGDGTAVKSVHYVTASTGTASWIGGGRYSAVSLVSGLNPGDHTFTAKYKSISGTLNCNFGDRVLTVLPL